MQREISWRLAVLSVGQAALLIAVAGAAIFFEMSWAVVGALVLLGGAALRGTIGGESRWATAVGWMASAIFWVFLVRKLGVYYQIETHHLVMAGGVVSALFITSTQMGSEKLAQRWRGLALTWALVASGLVLVEGYLMADFYGFHWAIAAIVATLIASRILLRLPMLAIQVAHTAILLLVGLPIADAMTRPSYKLDLKAETGKHYYSFAAAQEDPVAFDSWWMHFVEQWNLLHKDIAIKDVEKVVQYRLQPNSRTKIFESEVRINSLGFRGPEIKREKGEAYRIVALGESTTFGCTITTNGKPWPRVLEPMLRQEIDTDRPIQVINAGVYGLTLEDNVRRLKKRILALKPDMIISYHGYNFFTSLDPAIPPPRGAAPPAYLRRPLKLLADFEHQMKLRAYARSRKPRQDLETPARNLMETQYAEAYRELIRVTRKHGIRLVLANYSMAVNARSERDVIEFYRAGFPTVRHDIRANRAHSEIVARLAEEHPDVCYVDTHPAMDGKHEKFIDLVHFTQKGREEMAAIFLEAIKEIVAEDVAERQG